MGERGPDCIPEKNFLEDVLKQSIVQEGRAIFAVRNLSNEFSCERKRNPV